MFFSRLGDQVLLFIFPLAAYKISGDASWSGIAFFLESLPRFLMFPIAGILCDKMSCLTLLRFSQIARLIAALLFSIILIAFPSLWLLAIFSIVCGVLSTQGFISRDILLPYVFKDAPLEHSIARAQLADQVGMVSGPLLAGLLLTLVDWVYVAAFISLFFLISDAFLRRWLLKSNFKDDRDTDRSISFSRSFTIALGVINSSTTLKKLIGVTFLSNLMLGIALASSAVVVTGALGLPDFYYGFLQSIGALATIIILMFIGLSSINPHWFGFVGFVFMVCGFTLTGLIGNAFIYFFGFVVLIGFDKMFSVFVRYTRQQVVERKDLGKASGFIVLFNNISQPIGGLIFGFVSLGGLSYVAWLVSLISIMVFVVFWPSLKSIQVP
ncbi:MFS transporter [Salinicola sp. JS01]|uniref:MFS transporter n=1 Tax=Salinicola sp. JS01 TaxID=3050071 RepID=UPI00255BBE3D|nr:MFS transporter [Salinicola sp. JS01]WIX33269.1 MFS transporter [Salinicola sp. JS01]